MLVLVPHLSKGHTNQEVFIYLLKRSHRHTQFEFLFDVMKGFFFPLKVYGVLFFFSHYFLHLFIVQFLGADFYFWKF